MDPESETRLRQNEPHDGTEVCKFCNYILIRLVNNKHSRLNIAKKNGTSLKIMKCQHQVFNIHQFGEFFNICTQFKTILSGS